VNTCNGNINLGGYCSKRALEVVEILKIEKSEK
jgi:hypothetical protein